MSKVSGFKELRDKLTRMGPEMERFVADETEAAGRMIEADAKRNAPVDLGKLRQSINYQKGDTPYSANVFVNVPYAAYQEFGTGGLVSVPEELRELAEYYKGKGIKKIDLRPQPFLYPALVLNRKRYIDQLKAKLKQITR